MQEHNQGLHSQSPEHIKLDWLPIKGLWGLSLKIFILRLLTLNIYSFWGKTEVRRKVWSAVHLQGQPLEYTGRGLELFLGFLIVFFAVLLPLIAYSFAIQFYIGPDPKNAPYVLLASLPLYILGIYLFGVAQYRARRYRLSRTNWRGIRGTMSGSAWRYGWTSFWTALLIPLTLGWILPWRSTKLQRIMTKETVFGNIPLNFDGTSGPLYGPFAVLWIGSWTVAPILGIIIGILLAAVFALIVFVIFLLIGLPIPDFTQLPALMETRQNLPWNYALMIFPSYFAFIIGIVLGFVIFSMYYTSRSYNHFTNSTTFDSSRFQLKTTTWSLMWLTISNYLILLFTIGIAFPIVLSRFSSYFINRTSIVGDIDFNRVAQSQADRERTGEGLAEAFDIDGF